MIKGINVFFLAQVKLPKPLNYSIHLQKGLRSVEMLDLMRRIHGIGKKAI